MLFIYFLIETDFLCKRSCFLPANQNAHPLTHNQSKQKKKKNFFFAITIHVMSQPCLHILIETHSLSNERARTILNIFEQCMQFILPNSTIYHRKKLWRVTGVYLSREFNWMKTGQLSMIGTAEIAQEEELLCVGFCEWGTVKRHWKECNQPRRYYWLAQLPPCRVKFPEPCHTGLSSGNRNMNLTWL